MHAERTEIRPTKYEWKPLKTPHFVGAAGFFAVLFLLFSPIPGEESGGMALAPALTIYLCRPEGQRGWLLVTMAALAVAVVQFAGHLVGYALMGAWPPRSLPEGSDAHQVVVVFGMAPGLLILALSAHALGRRLVVPISDLERNHLDLSLLQTAILVTASLFVLFGPMLAGRFHSGIATIFPGDFVIVAAVTTLVCGQVLLVAWPRAGRRNRMLLARFGLSFLIGIAGSFLVRAVFVWLSPGILSVFVLFAVLFGAPWLGWWQLRNYARRHGMLRLNGPQLSEAKG